MKILYAIIFSSFLFRAEAAESERYIYLVSKPVTTDAHIWLPLQWGHYLLESGIQAGIITAAIRGSGHWAAGLPFVATGILKLPLFIRADSLVHLHLLGREQDLYFLMKLRRIPNLKELYLMSGTEDHTDRLGILVQGQTRMGMIGFETTEPLPDDLSELIKSGQWREDWGRPVRLYDLERSHLRLRMSLGNQVSPVEWNPTLLEVIQRQRVPVKIAEEWRNAYQQRLSEVAPPLSSKGSKFNLVWRQTKEYFRRSVMQSLHINADYISPDGDVTEIGSVIQAKPAAKFLRLNLLSRVRNRFRGAIGTSKVLEAPLPTFKLSMQYGFCVGVVKGLMNKFIKAPIP